MGAAKSPLPEFVILQGFGFYFNPGLAETDIPSFQRDPGQGESIRTGSFQMNPGQWEYQTDFMNGHGIEGLFPEWSQYA